MKRANQYVSSKWHLITGCSESKGNQIQCDSEAIHEFSTVPEGIPSLLEGAIALRCRSAYALVVA